MVNTLRITSLAAVALAVLVLASVLGPRQLVNLGMKSDAKLDRILGEPNVVDRFKGSGDKTANNADQTSMLVKQAQDFAKILNPAPAQTTKPPIADGKRGQTLPPPPPSSAKFTLVGLSYSAVRPDESFAYIKLADNTFQWVRKGDEIGHITIGEIRRGSILCLDGGRESEMMVVTPPDTASLLETAAGTPAGSENTGLSDKSKPGAPAKLDPGNDAALSRIADQIRQFQQAGSGDPNEMFRNRGAVMSQMVAEFQSSRAVSQPLTKSGNPDREANEPQDIKPLPRRLPYGRALTSPQRKTN